MLLRSPQRPPAGKNWAIPVLSARAAETGQVRHFLRRQNCLRQMTRQDYDHYDLIVAMDHNNLRNLRRIIGSDDAGKVSLSYGSHRSAR